LYAPAALVLPTKDTPPPTPRAAAVESQTSIKYLPEPSVLAAPTMCNGEVGPVVPMPTLPFKLLIKSYKMVVVPIFYFSFNTQGLTPSRS